MRTIRVALRINVKMCRVKENELKGQKEERIEYVNMGNK